MKNLPANIIIEKNRIATPNAWLILLEIVFTDNTKFYLVKNTENVVFQTHTYVALDFEIDPTKDTSQGDIPSITLRISNITRVMQYYVEALNGAINSLVTMHIVNSAYLAEDYSELDMTFNIIHSSCDPMWITFTLGAPNPLRRRFPLYRYIADHCIWTYMSRECNYTGELTTCKRTLIDCQAHNNQQRYGGFKGLSGGYFRVA